MKNILLFSLLFSSVFVSAQTLPCDSLHFQAILLKAATESAAKNYTEAIKDYLAAKRATLAEQFSISRAVSTWEGLISEVGFGYRQDLLKSEQQALRVASLGGAMRVFVSKQQAEGLGKDQWKGW